jgi:hypothetical protein
MSEIIARHVTIGACERCGVNADLNMVVMDYCTQNAGNCETCSLVSYGKDCRNKPVPEHGARELLCKHCIP